MSAARRLLPGGYRWVVLEPGEYAHIVKVEHARGDDTFHWNAPPPPITECGIPIRLRTISDFHITMKSAYEPECCTDCWKLDR